jgi:hypothetical protein
MDGGEFNLSYKYALTLSIIFVTITYFGPVPLLLPICSLYLAVQYWIDKIFFVRFCKIPPYYSESMHYTSMNIMPIAVILHCLFSMWAYGSPEVWPDGFHIDKYNSKGQPVYEPNSRSFYERLFNENSITFFILFILLII